MECKKNTVIHREHFGAPRIKEEHLNQNRIATETQTSHVQEIEKHFANCVQSSDVDNKVGMLQQTWDQSVAPSDINLDPKQLSTCLGIGAIKCVHEIDIKKEDLYKDDVSSESQKLQLQQYETYFLKYKSSCDIDTKAGIKLTWDPNSVSSDIKCDPEQSPTLDPAPFLGPGTIKGDDEIDIKEELYYCQETSTDSLNKREGSGSKRNEAAGDVLLLESSRQCTDAVFSSSATQLLENKCTCSFSTKTNTSFKNCETKHRCKTYGKSFKFLPHPKQHDLVPKECNWRDCDKNCTFTGHSNDNQLQNDTRQYICDTCGKIFLNLRYLKLHILLHDEKRLYECQTCEKGFNQLSHLKRHLLVHGDKRLYKCQICEKGFNQLSDLKTHLLVHNDKRQYKCKICKKSFKQLGSLKRHLLVHDDKRLYKCHICEKSFKQVGNLKTHLLVHDDKRPHTCLICEKSFKQLDDLKSHLLVHDDKRQFKCHICEKSFNQIRGLKSHLLIHDDKRRHKCQICEKRFNHLSNFKRHLLVHDDKRQHKCQVCDKTFKQLGNLKTHLLLHDNKSQYKCQICEKSFKQLPSLKSHLLVHDDNRQFKCEICDKSFKWLRSLKQHLLIHSKKNDTSAKLVQKV